MNTYSFEFEGQRVTLTGEYMNDAEPEFGRQLTQEWIEVESIYLQNAELDSKKLFFTGHQVSEEFLGEERIALFQELAIKQMRADEAALAESRAETERFWRSA
jgi:hypothetical protein